ncbi:MAG: ABC transporter permease [Flammeovirgaceae bacterium]|nr:ABC transporter permease [Flammeovirgaceae bacterium]|tara:strand:- start:1135 stop:3813 length:2679 start_codon:yes stop_codon:yes gene_type:complete
MKRSIDHSTPPRLGTYLLKKIYSEELFLDVSGDLEEIYQEQVEEKGVAIASCNYLIDVLLSVRNYNLRKKKKITQNSSIPMFKNYLKITLRTISKNKVYSALNIMGLALGIAAFIFILQYVTYENSYDRFHSNHQNIYRVLYKVYRGEELNIDCAAAVPRVGPFMKEKMPEVEEYVRAFPISGVMSTDNNKFREDRIHVTDPSFLEIFDYPLIEGTKGNLLNEPNQVVLTQEMAEKYFGNTDVIGKIITFNSWLKLPLKITGVTVNNPNNSHFKYDFLISYETLNNETRNDDGSANSETSWGWYDFNTYVSLRDGTDPKEFDKKFADVLYEERKEAYEKYNFHDEFPLQAITDIHLYSNLLQESEPEEQGDGDAVFFLSIIAFFILVIAWINYINLSTARAMDRSKEVGIRKTMGAFKKQLVYQFLAEAFFLNLFALVIGLVIVVLGINYFNQLTNSLLSLDFLTSKGFWFIAISVFSSGVLLSGLYPAFVLSSFKPVAVLKGKLKGQKTGRGLRRGLVTFQFAASVTLIAGTLIVYQQLKHMNTMDLGFDMTNTMVIKGPQVLENDSIYLTKLEAFRSEILNIPGVNQISASSNVPGDEIFWTNGIRNAKDPKENNKVIYIAGVDHDYFTTLGIELVAGRNYDRSFTTDTGAVILNVAGIKYLGFESPESAINQKVVFWGKNKTVIGVVDDYQQMSAKSKIAPIVFPLNETSSDFFSLNMSSSNISQQSLSKIQETYHEFFPKDPYDYFFIDEFFNRQYVNERTFSKVFTLFAIFGIIVACLGLFGLSSFTALQRNKEIGIRKALGASIQGIVVLLSKEFIILIIISNVIAWPIIYWVMEQWLNNFAARIKMPIWAFIMAGMIVLITALITVGYKTLRTAKSNPVKALRYE